MTLICFHGIGCMFDGEELGVDSVRERSLSSFVSSSLAFKLEFKSVVRSSASWSNLSGICLRKSWKSFVEQEGDNRRYETELRGHN